MYAIGDFTMLKNYLPYNNAEVKDKLQPQKKPIPHKEPADLFEILIKSGEYIFTNNDFTIFNQTMNRYVTFLSIFKKYT